MKAHFERDRPIVDGEHVVYTGSQPILQRGAVGIASVIPGFSTIGHVAGSSMVRLRPSDLRPLLEGDRVAVDDDWQPMSTAPFDRLVLVYCDRFEVVVEAIQYRDTGWHTFSASGAMKCRPIVWKNKPVRPSDDIIKRIGTSYERV